jgi:hypothetical protein
MLAVSANAQVITNPVLSGLIKKQNRFFSLQIPEKVYVHIDKPNYVMGDTIRLKAYVLDADYLTPTSRSGLLYVELDDLHGKAVKRLMLPVTDGLAWADIALNEEDVQLGSYVLRAYTNWMRNFGEDYIYKKEIHVSSAVGNATLVKANFNRQDNKVEAALQFSTLDGNMLRLKDMELKVMEGRKNLTKDRFITGMDGTIKINFELPQTTNNTPGTVNIQAKDVTKGVTNVATITIPLLLNRSQHTDVQFMPEGGNLVAGITTKVGFKAIGEDGKGDNSIIGTIINSKQQEVATFKTSNAGMGSFEFTPQVNEVYTAKVKGINKTYPLPLVNAMGTVLTIKPAVSNDSLSVSIIASAKLANQSQSYYLIGRARGVVCYAQVINFNNGQVIKRPVAKALFPTGIARFTLHNAANVPLNERQVFIDRYDDLRFTITNQMPKYAIRDSIALVIEVKDKNNKPVQGNFSIAITDNSQVKTDSLGSTMRNNLLLTTDLKGNVEDPGYYFTDPSKQKQAELDNLMLTQGWVGYDWKDVFAPAVTLAYQPEKEFVVQGKATNVFGKPIEKSSIVLALKKLTAVRDTLTDNLGRFAFRGLVPMDSAVILLTARNKRGRQFNISLDVEEFKEPVYKTTLPQVPWYVNTDTTLLKNSQAKATQAKAVEDYYGEGTQLREVVIKGQRAIKGSKNLNGPGGADEVIEEKVFHKANHQSLRDLLIARYKKDFLQLPFYSLKGHRVVLFIDGVRGPLTTEEYMNHLHAEDIRGIEIMNSSKYAMAYDPYYIHKLIGPERAVPIFLEVTTYSGNGAYLKNIPGTYLYRPIPFTLPKQFYSPKYTVNNKNKAMGTDMRSTLHWEPNILTDADGKATVSFFMADKPADFTIIIEGISGQGEVG